MKYAKIYTNLVRLITSQDFLGEIYFFNFTNRAIKETEIFIIREKSELFGHLKTYYA